MLRLVMVAAGVAGFAALATAAAAQAPDPVITNPNWLRKPSAEDLAAVWPASAKARGIDGRATISCEVSIEGTLQRCTVVSETPPGSGYGFAALSLAPKFQMTPRKVNGKPVAGGTVRIPITFETRGRGGGGSGVARYITNPNWLNAPTRAQVTAAYPAAALKAGKRGSSVLDCLVTAEGELRRCQASPRSVDARFDRAAESLAHLFRVEPPAEADGQPIRNVRVRVPVTFSPAVTTDTQIARPEWGRLPDAETVGSLYPPKAKAARAAGTVTVDCRVRAGGALDDCKVARETPAEMGFGEAALRLARHFRMRAWTSDGRPVDGARVRIPIAYQDPE